MNEPTTKAGRWLVDRARWDDGMRGFFVRINATGGPEDMLRHVLAIESEARAACSSSSDCPRAICGASFMAGAICELPAGHSGSHRNSE